MSSRSRNWLCWLTLLAAAWNLETKDQKSEVTTEIKSCLSTDLRSEERSFCRFFAIVIDGGSTGTRLQLYEFSHNLDEESDSPFRIEKETSQEVKPGLSSFADKPEKAAESIAELLKTAKKTIPRELWSHSPITIKATAGLRLLPGDQSDRILEAVDRKVVQSGFLIGQDAVGILSGTDEGVFSWFTLNALVGNIQLISPSRDQELCRKPSHIYQPPSVPLKVGELGAALDLGGGSTQITFKPRSFDYSMRGLARDEYSHRIEIFGETLELYTHSYLGAGLVAARLEILRILPQKEDSLVTNCMPIDFELKNWEYNGNWRVKSAGQTAEFESCYADVQKFTEELKLDKVEELEDMNVFAFSYFYDRAVQAEVIPATEDNRAATAKVGDFKIAAEKACAVTADKIGPAHWQPWQCMDLTYIYALLRNGYGFSDEKKITLVKRIRQMEVSWAMGAGYHLLNSYHQKSAVEHKWSKSLNESSVSFVTGVMSFLSSSASTVLTYFNIIS